MEVDDGGGYGYDGVASAADACLEKSQSARRAFILVD
jgi:hypothetical protein